MGSLPRRRASLGQVHAGRLHDGQRRRRKVAVSGVAEARIRADYRRRGFLRKLAGAETFGRTLDDRDIDTLATAVRGELDYLARRITAPLSRRVEGRSGLGGFPRVIDARLVPCVMTMTRARGQSVRRDGVGERRPAAPGGATAIFNFAWGSRSRTASATPIRTRATSSSTKSARRWATSPLVSRFRLLARAARGTARDADRERSSGVDR